MWELENITENIRQKILLIEDNYDTQLIFKIYLREFYDMEVAGTAEEGIEMLRKNNYDFLVLDINLPGKLDGSAVLNELRNKMNKKDFPVLVVTAYAMSGDREKYIQQGANAYLPKPVRKDDFMDKIRSFTAVA
ncbi:MAG: response regulator [Ignavibacteriaceae bacterium]